MFLWWTKNALKTNWYHCYKIKAKLEYKAIFDLQNFNFGKVLKLIKLQKPKVSHILVSLFSIAITAILTFKLWLFP